MIDQALSLAVDRLNGHLAGRFRTGDDVVVLSPLTDAEGKPADAARNKLALFVTAIAEDTMPRSARGPGLSSIGLARGAQAIHLDIYAMLAAAHDPDKYAEGLKQLSAALMFFQVQPVMTPQNTPDMPPGLAQLSFEIANLKVEEVGQLWGNLGGRYVPSVMFKIRSVRVDAGAIAGVAAPIRSAQRPEGRAGRGRE
ncbi:hypothetical protein BV509_12825 [Rhodovulum sulfidophilum]|uniref:DUF4255 domain-containing protein n=1 Tax=Rhodovulum visakhapatnamense TaxID=364297 RepID=A0A4R8FZH1_9RHOB|nr:DUF4255 domain-containing protein [Rhodovulum visakhapatnamense]MBL3570521.1 DUF4255 domain-containing protein [Rhodovulum visakhapatnamense]MBL3579251.1 DUF4255 domain-containing protein [Rhodovulum visakhapatnamense]OLS45140.1 hypothetical protein BV509_12825 [Rhodovulum sulfidophilum]TDX32513.1 uncharacterized protein DUF4255 [Rhodovulum visakhapatnamense]